MLQVQEAVTTPERRLPSLTLHPKAHLGVDFDDCVEVLEEAAGLASRRQTLVALPSGRLLGCLSSVLLRHCAALKEHGGAELSSTLVQIDFEAPVSDAIVWCDDDVRSFFKMLHSRNQGTGAVKSWNAELPWLVLSKVLGVRDYSEFCKKEIDQALLCEDNDQFLKNLSICRYQASDDAWRETYLRVFQRLENCRLSELAAPEHRNTLHAIFSPHELFEVVGAVAKNNVYGGQGEELVGKTVRMLRGGSIEEVTIQEYHEESKLHGFKCDYFYTLRWVDLSTTVFEIDGALVNFRAPLHTRRGERDVDELSASPTGEIVVLRNDEDLPNSMRLRIVIDEQLSIICDRDTMEITSALIREMTINEDTEIATTHLPFAASFPRGDVVQFFRLLHTKHPLRDDSPLCWVHLADHLQCDEWLEKLAVWVWELARVESFADWVVATRIHSIQQRRPEDSGSTLTDSDVAAELSSLTPNDWVRLFSGDPDRFIQILGIDVLLDALQDYSTYSDSEPYEHAL